MTDKGILDEKPDDLKTCVISGQAYVVPDYVKDFLNRRNIGDEVEFTFTEGEKGRRLTKIMAANRWTSQKTGTPAKTPAANVKSGKEQPLPQLYRIRVIKVNEIALKYETITDNPALMGSRLIMMTPHQFGVFTEAGVKDGDEIDILIDANGFITLPSTPPEMATFTPADKILQENIDKVEAEKKAAQTNTAPSPSQPPEKPVPSPSTTAPKESPVKTTQPPATVKEDPTQAPKTETTLSTVNGNGLTLVLGGTVNLENFENIRVEVSGPADRRDEMIEYVRETLTKLGNKDPFTKNQIDGYLKRVFA